MRVCAKRRRGLSTVVTSALMLTATAIIGSAIVSWSNGNLRAFETSLANSTSSYANQITENVIIENIAFCSASTKCDNGQSNPGVNVTLTNTGTISVNVTKISFNSTDYTALALNLPSSTPSAVKLPASILPKQSILLDISPLTWHSKSVSTITVTTKRNSVFTTQAAAP